MTARTSKLLAKALLLAEFDELAQRAMADEFHDFLSPHATPTLILDDILTNIAKDPARTVRDRAAASMIRNQLHAGEYDADETESADWAKSPAGKKALRKLAKDRQKRLMKERGE